VDVERRLKVKYPGMGAICATSLRVFKNRPIKGTRRGATIKKSKKAERKGLSFHEREVLRKRCWRSIRDNCQFPGMLVRDYTSELPARTEVFGTRVSRGRPVARGRGKTSRGGWRCLSGGKPD